MPKTAMHLVNRWTSLIFRGGFISSTVVTLLGFTSIPLLLIIKLRNIPNWTPFLSQLDPEDTLFRVEFHAISSKNFEHPSQILIMLCIMHTVD